MVVLNLPTTRAMTECPKIVRWGQEHVAPDKAPSAGRGVQRVMRENASSREGMRQVDVAANFFLFTPFRRHTEVFREIVRSAMG